MAALPRPRLTGHRTAAFLLVLAASVAGCGSSHSCNDLGDLRAQRDQARQESAKAVQLPPGPERDKAIERTHDRMHTLELAVYDLEQSCR